MNQIKGVTGVAGPEESASEVEVDRFELLQAIRHDCVTFLSFYLSDELTLEVPGFHIEIWSELLVKLDQVNDPSFIVGHLQKLFAVPREHSKSTLAKLAVILFMRYSPLAFTLYVSKTNSVAMSALRDVVSWFSSPQEVELYGKPVIIKSNETDSLWIMVIKLPDGRDKRIIMKALGARQQIRGTLIDNKRPELLILDDIEDYDTADGDTQQEHLDTWVMGTLMKATARRSVRLFLGNMVRSTTLLARLSKDDDWNPTVFGSLVKDKETGGLRALWEGPWTVESLLADYRKYRKIGLGHVWETEMMNLSADVILGQSLDAAIVVPDPSPEDVTAGFLCLDPAFGQKSWHDESAITVHVRLEGMDIPVTVDSRIGRWNESQILEVMIELSYYWNIPTWCIESVAAQRLFIPLFRLLLIDRQIKPELFSIIPIPASTQTKASRIIAYRQTIASKAYALSESQADLKLRLESYSPETKDHDDLCDSGAMGPLCWQMQGQTFEVNHFHNIAGGLMQTSSAHNTKSLGEQDVCLF